MRSGSLHRSIVFVLLPFAFVSLTSSAWAQKDAGAIVGVVRDSSGASVAKAKISINDLDRGTVFSTDTSDTGRYSY